MELVTPSSGRRTLWCELPQVIHSGLLGKSIFRRKTKGMNWSIFFFLYCRNHYSAAEETARGQVWADHFGSFVPAIAECANDSLHSESGILRRFIERTIVVAIGTPHSILRYCAGTWMLGSSSGRLGAALARERVHSRDLRYPFGTRLQAFRSLHQVLHQSALPGTNAEGPQV